MPDGGIVATYTDITERVKTEETLERRVSERTEELTRVNEALVKAKAEADEANIGKTRFLAGAGHDILQPLNAARLYATSLVERTTEGPERTLVRNIDTALEAVEEIIGAVLDISRLDTGALTPEITCLPARRGRSPASPSTSRRSPASKGLDFRVVPSTRGRPLGPPPAPAPPPESRLQCHQVHAPRPRPDRLPPARRAAS